MLLLAPLLSILVNASFPAPFQESAAAFDAPVMQMSSSYPPFRRLLDYDGDGDLDAVVVGETTAARLNTQIFENDGAGAFTKVGTPSTIHPDFFGPLLVEVGDLDDDGFDEFAIARGNQLWVRDFYGGQLFPYLTTLSGLAEALAVADMDGDNKEDIIVSTATHMEVHYASGAFVSFPHNVSSSPILSVRVFDADEDGLADIILGSPGKVTILHQSAGGACASSIVFAHAFANGIVDIGDIDGDTDVDIVVFDDISMSEYQVLRNQGPCYWSLEATAIGGPAEFLRDVDGDGDLDGVCCGGGSAPNPIVFDDPTPFQIALNDGTGNFAPAFQIRGLGSPQLCGVEDLDADGDIDLIAGRVVYYARGPITSSPSRNVSTVPFRPLKSDVCDFDGDGDPDLRLTVQNVYANDGNGNFVETATNVARAPRWTRWAGAGMTGDFDGDGDVDLLVEHRRVRGPLQVAELGPQRTSRMLGMRLLRNDGNGRFTDGGPASSPGVTFSVAGEEGPDSYFPVDLNADGLTDLVTRSMSVPMKTWLWHNTGGGFFVGPHEITDVRAEYVGDMNSDGLPEMIACTPGPFVYQPTYHWVSVLNGFELPSGFTGFAMVPGMEEIWPTNPYAHSLSFGDITNGGNVDFTVISEYSPMSTLLFDLRVNGHIGYGGHSALRGKYYLRSDAAGAFGDFTGDHLTDAVIGPISGDEKVEVSEVHVKRASPYVFELSHQLVAPGVLLDVDADGDLDVVGKDQTTFNPQIP